MKALSDCRLYAFVDAAYLDDRSPASVAESLCLGGADIIQWRAKDWPRERVLQTARELVSITQLHKVRLVVNDHLDIARDAVAGFCHLGQEDFFGAGRRHVAELATGGIQIGLSSHSPEQARQAIRAGASYIAVGPINRTPTKPSAAPTTLDYVRWAAANVEIPWFAIGGITLENLSQVLDAGARRICVVSAILRAPDVREACRQFRERIDAVPAPKGKIDIGPSRL
jgi:thiamine-phosphate pyrophosphorylase